MKKLTLIRHAKSSWDDNFEDFDRPLSDRGINDLKLMVSAMKKLNIYPDLVISSPANRALTTAQAFVRGMGIDDKHFKKIPDLYDFSGKHLVKSIMEVSDGVESLLVFGHNHAITYFVNAYGDKYIDNVPTCGLVSIEFKTNSWKQLDKGNTVKILFPSELRP